jgi:hypothetical protein
MTKTTSSDGVTRRHIFATWWPLAASWLLMSVELSLVSAVVARLPNPEISLAAFGGVVWPLSLLIESPIIMLLAASTALSRDWASYRLIRRYMIVAGATLTVIHISLAFTPLYYPVVEGIIGAPAEIVEPARIGLMLMTPWAWAIGYRRFNQGVLIRFGHPRAVGTGTAVRLVTDTIVLSLGYAIGTIPGNAVAAGAVAFGVISEAVYTAWRVRPVLQTQLRPQLPGPLLTWRGFLAFYLPLALTSFLTLAFQPIGSAALSRMPQALESLAVWPVLGGLLFMFRCLGVSYNEVVVALLERSGSFLSLRRFATLLASAVGILHLVVAATPLAMLWFAHVSALPTDLATLSRQAFWLSIPVSVFSVLVSWYQGTLLHHRSTRGVPESVVISLATFSITLLAGVAWGGLIGAIVGVAAQSLAYLAQTAWLWYRSRPVLRAIQFDQQARFAESQ